MILTLVNYIIVTFLNSIEPLSLSLENTHLLDLALPYASRTDRNRGFQTIFSTTSIEYVVTWYGGLVNNRYSNFTNAQSMI